MLPILENVLFISGLSLFGSSIYIFSILVLVNSFHDLVAIEENFTAINLPIVKLSSSLMYITVWGCFTLSYKEVYGSLIFSNGNCYYYELLFWSGGHLCSLYIHK